MWRRSDWMLTGLELAVRGLAVALVLTGAWFAALAVTIEVDESGAVTVRDPDGRVTVVAADVGPGEEAAAAPSEGDGPALGFGFEVSSDGWPGGSSGWRVRTPADWPLGADVLVLAWSEDQGRMLPWVSARFERGPVVLEAGALSSMLSGVSGEVELQALWRVDGATVSKATRLVTLADDDVVDEVLDQAVLVDAGFTAWPLHASARRVHVSNDGDDGRDGWTEATAVRTLGRGLSLMRSGFGDQLLLRAGDTFETGLIDWRWSGRSAAYPAVLGVYGSGDRPRVWTDGSGFLHASGGRTLEYVAVQGLHVTAVRRTLGHARFDAADLPYREDGLVWMSSGRGLWIEDCVFERFRYNVVLSAKGEGDLVDVVLRRCVLADAWSHWDGAVGGHSSGIYAQRVVGLRIEETVFDHNGWAEGIAGAKRTKFNHNLYLNSMCRDVSVVDCVIARGSSYGLQLRPGGLAAGNLLARNALGMYFAWHPSEVLRNVVVESGDSGESPDDWRGYGIEVWPVEGGLVAENLVMHKRGRAKHAGAIEVAWWGSWRAEVSDYRVELRDNTVVGWPVSPGPEAMVVRTESASVTRSGNVLDAASGGKEAVRFARPGFTLDDAAGGDFEGWLARAKSRPRGTWPAELTAGAINAELFAAYRVVDE